MHSPDTVHSENEIGRFGRSALGGEKGDFVESILKELAEYNYVFFFSIIVTLLNHTIIV